MKLLLVFALVTCSWCDDRAIEILTESNNAFTTKLLKELSKSNSGNFIVSPHSVETILALTALGAKGDTATEVAEGLCFLYSGPEEMKSAFQSLQPLLKSGRFHTLATANKIYIEKGFGISPDFLEVASTFFGSGLENVNFGETEKTASKINRWVENRTDGKIQKLIGSDMINELTRVILVNALYFKGQWVHTFKEGKTKDMPFHKSETEVLQVPTMETTAFFKYAIDDKNNITFVELPYGGTEVSMMIVMPDKIQESALTELDIDQFWKPRNFTRKNIKVLLPKFKIETTLNLISTLQNLGIKKLFNRDADLSGMSINEGLYVTNVVQKSFIEVNEYGTEAAAATAVISNARSAIGERQSKLEIKIDRPFLFFLKFRNIVLFGGRISAP